MNDTELDELRELLRRKELAASQFMEALRPGDEIFLRLTAADEGRLKYLLQKLLNPPQTPFNQLIEQAKITFIREIEKRRDELIAMSQAYALTQIHDEYGLVLDDVLDERQPGFTQMLITILPERPDFLTTTPPAFLDGYEGIWTAQHLIYHHLYDLLREYLEFAFCIWHQEHHRDE